MKKIVLLMVLFSGIVFADKIKTIKEIRINFSTYPAGSYLEVSSDFAKYLTNEDENKNKRSKKAIRTPQDEVNNIHIDLTNY